MDVADVLKKLKFEGFDRESHPQCFRFQIFFFFVERIRMDNSYIL